MADNKKSFLLYCDYIDLFKQLPDEVAGKLIKHIFDYTNDLNPETDDLLLKIAFEPIKKQLKRDLIKYQDVKVKRSEAGKLSAAKRALTKSTSVESVEKVLTNPTVIDTVNVTDTVTVIDKDIKRTIKAKRFLPPTIEEIKSYCIERNNKVDPVKFFNHYEAADWMRGKSKIKKWKACIITWEKNEQGSSVKKSNEPTSKIGKTQKACLEAYEIIKNTEIDLS